MTPPTLLTIPVSHYCEKVRWAFERAGVAFREEGHLPVFNRLAGLRYGAWNSVPLLVTPEGLLRDSSVILRWVDERTAPERRLRPDDPTTQADVATWERLADAELGPATRRIGYAWVLPDRELALRVSSHGVPALEVLLLRWSFPLVRYGMARDLQIDPPHLAAARDTIDALFARVAERLRDGRPYLCGDRFTAADLTFAALAAPVIAPPAYGGPLPALDALPPDARADVDRWRDTPAGRFVMRVYEGERR